MTRRAVPLTVALLSASALRAQQVARPPLTLVPHGDSVLLYLTEPPPPLGGFVVYRAQAGATPSRITPDPIRGVREPALAAGMLGADLPAVLRALRATDEAEMLRRLRADRFGGAVLSLLYRPVAVALGRCYADPGLTRGAAYDYQVVFTDAAGRETERRLSGRVTVTDETPASPAGARVEPGDHEAAVTWRFAGYRADPRDFVVGFHVYRADGPAGAWRRLTATPILRDDAAPPAYRDDDVHNGTAYRYRVTAVDLLGVESAPSATIVATPADRVPPAPPVGLSVRTGDSEVLLVWRMAVEPDAAGYHVERSLGLSQPFRRLTTTPVGAADPQWLDTTVTGGRQYFYRVIALDAAGNASAPSNAITALPEDHTPPAPPVEVTATLTGHIARVRWSTSPSRGVLGYHVYRDATRLTSTPIAALALTDSGYGGTGLIPGHRYEVRVSAVDSSFNESPATAAELIVPDDQAPTPPTGFTARGVPGRYVELGWAPSGALDVRRYVLSRRDGAGPVVEVAQVEAETTGWRDSAVTAGRTYAYQLVAVDSAGNRSVAVADTLRYGDGAPPAPPRSLAARLTPDGVELTWERVASHDLVGYLVYRSSIPTGVFQRVTATPVPDLRFVDRAGAADFYYVVRAVDRSGNESAASPVATGRTP